MFEEHLRTLNSDNPLCKLLNSGGIFNSNKCFFIFRKTNGMTNTYEPSMNLRKQLYMVIYSVSGGNSSIEKEGLSSVIYPENLELVPWSIARYLHLSNVKEFFYPGEPDGFYCDTSVCVVSYGVGDI